LLSGLVEINVMGSTKRWNSTQENNNATKMWHSECVDGYPQMHINVTFNFLCLCT